MSKKLIDFKIVFYLFSITTLFVSIDIIFQFFAGYNIFGYVSPYTHKNTGLFFDEAIAGGYIQRFSLFVFFTFIAFINVKNNTAKIYILSSLFLII